VAAIGPQAKEWEPFSVKNVRVGFHAIGEIPISRGGAAGAITPLDGYWVRGPKDAQTVGWDKIDPNHRVAASEGSFSIWIGDLVLSPPWVDGVKS